MSKSSYAILGLLSKYSYSGYELKRRIIKTSSFYCSESSAQIYPVLKKLEVQELLTSNIDKASGARNKRIYAITKKGRDELIKWLKTDSDVAIYREEFLIQLSLSQHLTTSQLSKKISHYQQSIQEKLEILTQVIKHIKKDHAGKEDQQYLLLTYDHIHAMLDAKLQWCIKILKNLNK